MNEEKRKKKQDVVMMIYKGGKALSKSQKRAILQSGSFFIFYFFISMAKQWKTKELKVLASMLLEVENEKDMLSLLRDLCSNEELVDLSMRWHIAGLLADGMTYREIAAKTGVSTTTVTRIAQALWHGEGGYLKMLGVEE